ncbi:MAG: RrF2 family transcriptional regulator [bacterium]
MRISRKGDYALRAMAYLAMNYGRGRVRISEIARHERIPKKFLEQILLQLRRAGLVESKRGIGGGYSLMKAPHKVSLAQIIRIIDGPLAPLGCVSKYAHVACPDENRCGLRRVMAKVRDTVASMLENLTLDDVCK